MQHYETVIVLSPSLSEVASEELINKFQSLLIDSGAEIVHQNNWGLKKLAYTMQKNSTGIYHVTEFKALGDVIKKLETAYKREERLLRFLTISLDKHAVSYNDRKRTGTLKKPAKTAAA